MEFTNNEKLDMVEVYFLCNRNCSAANIAYQQRYPDRRVPNRRYFKKLIVNLAANGSFVKPRQRVSTVVTDEFEIDVLAYFEAFHNASIREVASILQTTTSSIFKVLKKNKYHAYKYATVQALLPGDENRRLQFCGWLAQEAVNTPGYLSNIIWTDETNFSNRGMWNRKNNHYWAKENPLVVREGHDQVRFSINCWCAVLNNAVIAVHFYEGNLTRHMYLQILENILLDSIEDVPINVRIQLMYQQDGAPPHNSRVAVEFLNTHFPGKWLGTNGPLLWPARSPDLTPMDFFLWGFLKDELYKSRYNNVADMTTRVREILHGVHHNTLNKAVNDVLKRATACIYTDGGHFEHLL